ncbi:MAG: PspC domain-containing protein [Sphingomonadales bacterium]|jgi:phage shock protein C|nr:PspC domain-containing protein [Sphingomonadales bacterium]
MTVPRTKFHLNKAEAKVSGVCAGLADYTGWDATWVRVGTVAATVLGGFPWTLIAYGVTAWAARPNTDVTRWSGHN